MAAIVREGLRSGAKPLPAANGWCASRARHPSRQGAAPASAKSRDATGPGWRPAAVGVLAGAVVIGGLAAVLLTGDRLHKLHAGVDQAAAQAMGRIGFKVAKVHVE